MSSSDFSTYDIKRTIFSSKNVYHRLRPRLNFWITQKKLWY